MTLALGNGQPDSFFVSEVRRIFRDQPRWIQESPGADGSRGAIGSATSSPIKLQQAPVLKTRVSLTAPGALNQPGLTSYSPLFEPPAPIAQPFTSDVPTISDNGAGVLGSGSYQVIYTYVTAAGEFGMSQPSNVLALGAGRQFTVGQINSIPTAVTAIRYYLIQSPGPNVGFVGSQAPAAGSVPAFNVNAAGNGVLPALIVSDTAELFFPLAPVTGAINAQYQSARYSDQQVLDALYEGLGMLWPEVWSYQPADLTSVLPSPVQYEYVLPVAPYADQRIVITEVEVRPPQAWVRFRRISGWRYLNDPLTPTLIFEKTPPPGGQVRITAVQPFQQLADVPGLGATGALLPPANLPVYYAVGRLLADAEVMRSRADDLPSLTAENAGSEKGGNLQTASFWFQNMFGPELTKLSIGRPARRTIQGRIVERLALSGIWQEAA